MNRYENISREPENLRNFFGESSGVRRMPDEPGLKL